MNWSRARELVLILVVASLAGAGAACGTANNPYIQTGPTPTATTDTFTGTLTNDPTIPVMRVTHTLTTTYTGAMSIVMTSIQPDSTLVLGFGVGTWDPTTSTCGQLLAWNNTTSPGTIIVGNALVGSFCIQVYDVGNLASGGTTTYTFTVTHY